MNLREQVRSWVGGGGGRIWDAARGGGEDYQVYVALFRIICCRGGRAVGCLRRILGFFGDYYWAVGLDVVVFIKVAKGFAEFAGFGLGLEDALFAGFGP